MLCKNVEEAARKVIEQMIETREQEMKIPNTPLTVIKTGPDFKIESDWLPVARLGRFLVVQKGL